MTCLCAPPYASCASMCVLCVCVCLCRPPCVFSPLRPSCTVAQSCLTLCDPMDCNPLGSSIHGVFQSRMLEWIAISSSRGSFWPSDPTCISGVFCIDRWILYHWATWEALSLPIVTKNYSFCRKHLYKNPSYFPDETEQPESRHRRNPKDKSKEDGMTTLENSLAFPQKVRHRGTFMTLEFCWMYTLENWQYVTSIVFRSDSDQLLSRVRMQMFMTALFMLAKHVYQPMNG